MAKLRSDIDSKRTKQDVVSRRPLPEPLTSVLIAIVLGLLTLAVFHRVATFEFVNYDDGDYVMSNSEVQKGVTWHGVQWAFTTGHAANWHPLTWLSHMVDYQLFGKRPGWHHVISVLLHAVNAILLFFLLRKMTNARWRSAFIAAVFALHPVHVESVAWLSERKDVLSGLFWILTMVCYVCYVHERRSGEGRGRVKYGLALVTFALGLLCKPMLVTLPFVLLLIDLWPLNRISTNQGVDLPWRQLRRLVLEKVPFLVLALSSSLITFLVQQKGGAVASIDSLSFGSRLANAFVSYLRYTGKMLFPHDLAVLYPHPGSWRAWLVCSSVMFVLSVVAVAVWQLRRRPYLFVGCLWFFGTMVPVIGIVQVGIQSMADRYTYIPSIGFSIALVWLVVDVFSRFRAAQILLNVIAAVLVLACVPLTYKQVGYWQNSETLFRRTVSVTENNYLAWNNLGFSLPKSRAAEAIECYRQSVKINPAYPDALNNLGHALAEQGNISEAIPLYQRALSQQPKNADINNNYGNALAEIGKVDEAIQHYLIALASNTNHADAHNNFGIALAMRGRLEEAVFHLQRAVELDPDKASAHSNLGNAFAVQHKLTEATLHYREALRLKPDEAQVHNNLGNVLSEQNKFQEAIEQYELALKLHANNPEAHYNLALAYLRLGRHPEAVQHLQAALQLRPNYPEAQRQLAAINARS